MVRSYLTNEVNKIELERMVTVNYRYKLNIGCTL